ncbi:MAG: hypothetical protein FIA95_09935 [Gemmatimonadetes bacterium]|nr:hypothetical protein [Gemmatimonadota bacterium]
MSSWIVPILVGAALGVALRYWHRAWRRHLVASRRRVELPNSAYSSPGVRQQEDRARWGRIEVHSLHPLNRDEVQRLLDLVDREGIHALNSRERLFLDNMTLPRMG